MIDLEKEKMLARKWHDECCGDIDFIFNPDEYVVDAWTARAEIAQEEEAKLQAQITELKQKLAQSETENKTMGSNNVWLNNKYGELEKKLASYESPDYVLVPREPTKEMIDAGEWELLDLNENVDYIYKAMIEAVEKDND